MCHVYIIFMGGTQGVTCVWLGGALAKNRTYRAFVARPTHVLGLDGELLDSAHVLAWLASEVRDISTYATYVVRNDRVLGDELAHVAATSPADAGRLAGVAMPELLATGQVW